ncbi:MAG TPA: SUMF1/EgtB/PvdO family nonheme iron enzyme [Bdellovibrionota bacterium]|nr:SUMF1/EgtB/PvdO family nonheme iron enzyme [Bdellovibrionota bacterium]
MLALLATLSCPPDMAAFSNFCMDRYEAPNREGEHPLTGKTAAEGEAWCGRQGKFLCDEDQWMEACQGEGGRPFPYGQEYERGRCNDDKTWISPDWSAIASYPAPAGQAEIERLNQTDPSGSRAGCSTPEGVYDLTGNVAEWVLSKQPHPGGYRHVMKGCYWAGCYGGSPPRCAFTNPAHPGTFRTYEAGFRCCLPAQRPVVKAGFSCDPAVHPAPNAGLTESPGDAGCPAGMTSVAGFCMDRFEASLIEVGKEEHPWSPYHNPGTTRVRAVSLENAVPQGYINGYQAAQACKESGKRLCTSDEWLSACRGKEQRIYPYGFQRRDGLCADSRSVHPAYELFPNDPHPLSHLQHACINQQPDTVSRTGAHDQCVIPEGAYDLMGNMHEWVADAEGTFRGGFYVDTKINGEGCLYRTVAHSLPYWDYSTGFRCCADRAPAAPFDSEADREPAQEHR